MVDYKTIEDCFVLLVVTKFSCQEFHYILITTKNLLLTFIYKLKQKQV